MTALSVKPFINPQTRTVSYIISDNASKFAAAIDPTFTLTSNCNVDCSPVEALIHYVNAHQLTLQWILETHTQPNHYSASHFLKHRCNGEIGISKAILRVPTSQASYRLVEGEVVRSTQGYDYLFDDGEVINLGHIPVLVMLTPGLSLASACYQIGDIMFTGAAFLSITKACGENLVVDLNGIGRQSLQKLLRNRATVRLFNGFTRTPSETNLADWESSIYRERHRLLRAPR